jgi:putative salt-induced outer membrane protein YdiY
MVLKEKIEEIMSNNGISTQKDLANRLNLNYVVFNRNVDSDNLTGDMIKAFANDTNLKFDLIKLIRGENANIEDENSVSESPSSIDKLNLVMSLLEEIKEEISRK